MKISEQWLREWVKLNADPQQISEQLTMAGLEVEGITPVKPKFSGVVTALVEKVEAHTDTEKLKICQISTGTGQQPIQVVCGADNVRTGLCVALAQVGAVLPGVEELKPVELHNVLSKGMLCSAAELGLSEKSIGIMELPADLPLGVQLADALALNDQIIELSLTPNRGDCLSVAGIARELSAINRQAFAAPVISRQTVKTNPVAKQHREIIIDDHAACPRYIGQIISGVDVSRISPLWLTERLRRCGLNSINAVVDVTNYVMLELGQPMHAYDNDKLNGTIRVRYAKLTEAFQPLDRSEDIKLSTDTLVIADDCEILAIAGIIGGRKSAVLAASKNIFLESAFFNPHVISGKARQNGLQTESSHRFERGVDFAIQQQAINRAAQLIIDICGGSFAPINEALANDALPMVQPIQLRYARIERLLGTTIPKAEVGNILTDLGMQISSNETGWMVSPPSFRFDIHIEADLIEEIVRIYGYNNIKTRLPKSNLRAYAEGKELHTQIKRMRTLLVARGFHEVISYSFVDEEIQQIFNPKITPIQLSNPIAPELSVMRSSLLPGLVKTMLYNQKRQQQKICLFEVGSIFMPDLKQYQGDMIAGIINKEIHKKQWDREYIFSDLFDLKGHVEALFELCNSSLDLSFGHCEHPALHPGKSAEIILNHQGIGFIGSVHPTVQRQLGLAGETFVFELSINNVYNENTVKYCEISKFPSLRRDISIVVAEDVPVATIIDIIEIAASPILYDLELFDLYQGEKLESGRKSLSFHLIFQRISSTLTDMDVDSVLTEVLNILKKETDGSLREE